MKIFIDNAKSRVGGLSFNQKVMLGAVTTASIISLVIFSTWIQKEEMGVLFTNMTQEDAGATIAELDKLGIKYDLSEGSTTVRVPENEVGRLRLELANKGVISNSIVGFDIFDGKQYGLTEFLQNVQFKRALEGELTRTIETINGIQSARVHLVLPKDSIFSKNKRGATSSVLLKVSRGASLSRNQVAGIQSLVAFSVENLTTENVRVMDQSGQVLFEIAGNDEVGLSSTQLDHQHRIESDLKAKAQAQLDRVLGPGKSKVQVAAIINWKQSHKEIVSHDPKISIPITSNRKEKINADGSTEEESLENYEIATVHENVVEQTGDISSLQVSVTVDGNHELSEDGSESIYTPLSEERISQLKRVVSAAVGLNSTRGDRITFENIEFAPLEEFGGSGMAPDWIGIATQYGGKMVLFLAFGLMALTLKKNLGAVLSSAMSPGGGVGGSDFASGEDSESFDGIPDIDDRVMDDIQAYSAENPERVAEVVQSWINDIDLGPAATAKAGE
ncbi:MAG: flagellar M-ring protein FliF [bacterium]|nr:flagellar M-ring protein FliF [bacterium]